VSAKPSPPKNLPDSDDLRAVLAYRIRTLRVELGWSQERLALECDLDRTYVSAIERCVWNVSLSSIEVIANALGTKPWLLLVPPDDDEFALAFSVLS
jgi:transcriptional regulator with XRE-family HTH domain